MGLKFRHSKWYSHCVYVVCTDLRKTATFALHNINALILYNRGWEYLLRVTRWVLTWNTRVSPLMRCNTLHYTVWIMYLLRSGPEVLLLCEFIFVSVKAWNPPPRRISRLMFPFQLSVVLRLLWLPPPLLCLAPLRLCVCFQYRFISILAQWDDVASIIYVFSCVKLALCGLG